MADAEQPLLRRLLTSVSGTLTAMQEVTLAAGSNVTITPTRSGNRHTLTIASTGGGGGGAPTSSQYVTLATDATLTAERVLTGTSGRLTVTDNGAGSTVVLDVGADVYRVGGTDVAVADGGTGASTASGARTNLGLVIGTDVQAYDAQLAALAATTPTAGSLHTWSSATSASVLAAGSDGQSLVMVAGAPAWVFLGIISAVRVSSGLDMPLTGGDQFVTPDDPYTPFVNATVT